MNKERFLKIFAITSGVVAIAAIGYVVANELLLFGDKFLDEFPFSPDEFDDEMIDEEIDKEFECGKDCCSGKNE